MNLIFVLAFMSVFLLSKVVQSLSLPENTLSFILLGDWGKGGVTGSYGSMSLTEERNLFGKELFGNQKTYYQVAIAQQMALHAQNADVKPSFVIALGDNFYTKGVASSTDVLWSYLWKDVYLSSYPELNIPWYPVFGNHDYAGGTASTEGQLQRYKDHTDDDAWQFESQYYVKQFHIPGGGSVVILFIDTTTLAPSECKYTNANYGISTETQTQRIVEQMTWINDTLTHYSGRNRPTWLFVSGHYPVFSSGDHGDIAELNTYLQPVLKHHEIDAYFCGHDHHSEHMRYTYENEEGIQRVTNHFIAGAGSMTDGLKMTSTAEQVWTGTYYSAFAQLSVTKNDYTVQYIDSSGVQKYVYTVNNMRTAYPTLQPSRSPSTDINPLTYFSNFAHYMDSQPRVVVITGSALCVSVMLAVCIVMYQRRVDDNKSNKNKMKIKKNKLLQTAMYNHLNSPHENDNNDNDNNSNSNSGGFKNNYHRPIVSPANKINSNINNKDNRTLTTDQSDGMYNEDQLQQLALNHDDSYSDRFESYSVSGDGDNVNEHDNNNNNVDDDDSGDDDHYTPDGFVDSELGSLHTYSYDINDGDHHNNNEGARSFESVNSVAAAYSDRSMLAGLHGDERSPKSPQRTSKRGGAPHTPTLNSLIAAQSASRKVNKNKNNSNVYDSNHNSRNRTAENSVATSVVSTHSNTPQHYASHINTTTSPHSANKQSVAHHMNMQDYTTSDNRIKHSTTDHTYERIKSPPKTNALRVAYNKLTDIFGARAIGDNESKSVGNTISGNNRNDVGSNGGSSNDENNDNNKSEFGSKHKRAETLPV